MAEYFVVANSNAAPFFSDTSESFVAGKTPEKAMEQFRNSYKHPAGLYAAILYKDADAYHKGRKPLAEWLSDRAKASEFCSFCGVKEVGIVYNDYRSCDKEECFEKFNKATGRGL